jgi:O-acetyl-ADP-ribose deacetylase (regulator of RNase III)
MVKEINGDLLKSDVDIICHQTNCQGKMNSGIAKAIRETYPEVYKEYNLLCTITEPEKLLGEVQPVNIGENKWVMNMFSQLNFGYDGKRYTSYDAIWSCLWKVKTYSPEGLKIGFPARIGCVRGGANWNVVKKMIEEVFTDREVYIYDLGI